MRWHRLAVVALSLLVGCRSPKPTDTGSVQESLDSTLREHARLAIARNVDGIVAQYTPDAVVRSNHVAPLRGHAAIRAFITQMMGTLTFDSLSYHTEHLAVYRDSAWHIVNYRFAGAMGGQAIGDSGSAFLLWTRDSSGAWRIKDDILNSQVPLTAPPR